MNGALDEPALLMEVPPVLKKLVKRVIRGFYDKEHVALMNVLTNAKHPCVKEDDLLEMLKFDKKQLRQTTSRLKNDKLIKQRIHKEKQTEPGSTPITFNYYFINYKLFVNVVRYKLDHIRKKIESDEKQAKNRPSFLCTECKRKYSDLEVDRLIDMMSGLLKCTFCSGIVEEDVSEIQQGNTYRTSLARFNEQLEPIFLLLKESENINLAPSVLEPEPDLAAMNVHMSRSSHGSHGNRSWSNDRRGDGDVGDVGIKISMGPDDDEGKAEVKRTKEAPEWMKHSTVATKEESKPVTNTATTTAPHTSTQDTDNEILADLLAHESVSKKPRLDVDKALGNEEESESSDDSDDEKMTSVPVAPNHNVTETMAESESDGEDEMQVKVNGKMVSLHDVTQTMIESMTAEEKEAYHKAYHQACSAMF
ncbi:general transcription factor IIE subunit 1-like [Actinia tenebrosa]|uniref:General transcription factor IIE subunit 1-like n=1 Tax=Actinia tenebrosa TaxID=6105 RepID=A0A6P8HME8_ACTTE|nr:general transcription factor IIE subunit 1-like [Actinia tenebrosa]